MTSIYATVLCVLHSFSLSSTFGQITTVLYHGLEIIVFFGLEIIVFLGVEVIVMGFKHFFLKP